MRGGEREGRPSVPSAAAQPLRFTLSGHDDDDDQFDSHPIAEFERDDLKTTIRCCCQPGQGPQRVSYSECSFGQASIGKYGP
jgi:hypothetical protein